ncbi:MAG TPA: nucleoside hydrolase [Clostridiales bacterium]|nr:nucleoside hydrolase [Clostridiales bacterium]
MDTKKKKVLFDTDIGSDIDDAVALAYLLRQPMCELVGITTVTGDTVKRAQLASVLCLAAGKGDVPIYPGCRMPLLDNELQPHVPQADVLPLYNHQKEFPMHRHIQFMIDTIRANPGEISLLAVGPMTNIGLLFATDPEIPGLLKELVLMCGVFTNTLPRVGPREWNAYGDSHSTAIIYNTRPAVHRSIGLDVTCQVTMGSNEVRERFNVDLLKIVLTMAEIWFNRRSIITFHDPLAASTLFDESICGFERGKVDVELLSDRVRGMTYFKADKENGPHEVALRVNKEKFFEHYFSLF